MTTIVSWLSAHATSPVGRVFLRPKDVLSVRSYSVRRYHFVADNCRLLLLLLFIPSVV